MGNKASEFLIRSSKKNHKDKLQNGEHIPIENKFTKDHIRENATIKANHLEEMRNKIKFRDEKRSEIHDYWNMNNKLINKTLEKSPNDISGMNEERINFKSYKDLSIKCMKEDKQKNLERKNSCRNSIGKVTEFVPMKRDLSKIQLEKNIIGDKIEIEKKIIRSKSSLGAIKGRNLFNIK
jgi:hypothetical protein